MKNKYTIIYKTFGQLGNFTVCKFRFIECEKSKIYELEDNTDDEYDDINQICYIFEGWVKNVTL
jgi:hypothetical protein